MKTILLTLIIILQYNHMNAQHCRSNTRPDYFELLSRNSGSNYKPCKNQNRKASFYLQQQKLENRIKKILINNPNK